MSDNNLTYTFNVDTHDGLNVFTAADEATARLCVEKRGTPQPAHLTGDEFDVYTGGDKLVTIVRNGETLDSGIVGYRGAHGGDVRFVDFKRSYIDAANPLGGTPNFLLASTLQPGDVVKISSPTREATI